jgi:hypothetical protein
LIRVQKEAQDSDSKLHKLLSGASEIDSSSSNVALRQKFIENLRVGHLTKWVISSVSKSELIVLPIQHILLGLKMKAIVHISGAIDHFKCDDKLVDSLNHSGSGEGDKLHDLHPFFGLEIGSHVWCHVLQVRRESSKKKGKDNEDDQEEFIIYLSLSLKNNNKDSVSQENSNDHNSSSYLPFKKMIQTHGKDELKTPSLFAVVITKIDDISCTVALSPYIYTQLNFVDISNDKKTILNFKKKCFVGMRLVVLISQILKDDGKADLSV